MKVIDFLILLLSLICIGFGIRELWYLKKGWGIRVHLFDSPFYAMEKPKASKMEKINLLIQGVVFLMFGIGIIVIFMFRFI